MAGSINHWTCYACGGYASDELGYLVCVNCGFLAKAGWVEHDKAIHVLTEEVRHLRTVALEMLAEGEKAGLV